MSRVSLNQTNFTAGELSPRLLGRVDISRYQNGAERIRNAYALIHGGLIRRPGTVLVAPTKTSAKRSRLIPFVFSRDDAYMLEFGDLYMRVYKNGGRIEASPGVPYEIATPYTEAMLDSIDYTQGAETMFLFHGDVPMQRLRRFGDAKWSLAATPFSIPPFDELGETPATTLTLSAATVGAGRTATAGSAAFLASDVGRQIVAGTGVANITAVASATSATVEIIIEFDSTSFASGGWTIAGSPQTSATPSGTSGSITITLGANGFRSSNVGACVVINGGVAKITAVATPTSASATVLTVLDGTVASPANAWTLEAPVWSAATGYPRTGTLFEQRLYAAGTKSKPQGVWGSALGIYLDFLTGDADDDSVAFTLASDQQNEITYLASGEVLSALTLGGEFTVRGGNEKPITPTNIKAKNHSGYGCAPVRPVRVGNEEIYVQRSGKKVRALAYSFADDTFKSPIMSVLSEHVTKPGVVSMAYQQEPESLVWLALADGSFLSLTIDRDQDVIAWCPHTTQGTVESVASIPSAAGDDLWMIVKRSVNGADVRYVERMVDGVHTDCAILGTHPTGVATWTGLSALEGVQVEAKADGLPMGVFTVTGGTVTLPRAALSVEFGMHYDTEIDLLPVEVPSGEGTTQGNAVRTGEAVVRLKDTIGCTVNGEELAFRRLDTSILDQDIEPFTGDKVVKLSGWERSGGRLSIRQNQPMPFHLLSVMRKVTVNTG